MLIALLFAMPSDIQGTLNSTTQYPYMSIYTHAVGSNAGGTAMVRIDWLSLFRSLLRDSWTGHVYCQKSSFIVLSGSSIGHHSATLQDKRFCT